MLLIRQMRSDSLNRLEQSLSRTFTGMDWLDDCLSFSLQDLCES